MGGVPNLRKATVRDGRNKKPPAEVLGEKDQRAYVYTLCFEDGKTGLEETSVSDLQEYERLPDGEPLPYL